MFQCVLQEDISSFIFFFFSFLKKKTTTKQKTTTKIIYCEVQSPEVFFSLLLSVAGVDHYAG